MKIKKKVVARVDGFVPLQCKYYPRNHMSDFFDLAKRATLTDHLPGQTSSLLQTCLHLYILVSRYPLQVPDEQIYQQYM